MTEREYLELDKKHPWYNEYEGREEDKEKIIEYNKGLIEKYPWLLPRNRWTGEVVEDYDYHWTELDEMPEGWRIAFGLDMCEEIQQALIKAQEQDPNGGYEECGITTNYDSNKIIPYVEGFRIMEIKEKYGELRFYCGSAPQEVFNVIHKYEIKSQKICIGCGKRATKISLGWISPWCDECAKEIEGRFEEIKNVNID